MPNPFGVRQQLVLLGLVFFLSFFLSPDRIATFDHEVFIRWVEKFASQGIPNAYFGEFYNYGPVVVYLFAAFGFLVGSRLPEFNALTRQVYFLFDLGAIFLLMRYLERYGLDAMRALFVLFNIAFLYNSLIWGQMDGVFTVFVLACFLAGLVGQPELAVVMFVLAFNVKPQPIIYLPLVGLLLIPLLVRQPNRLLTTLAAGVGAQLVLLIPFLANGAWRDWINIYLANGRIFPFASMNAHNLWYLVLAGDPVEISDTTVFLFWSYKRWGVLLFVLFGLVALLPLAVRVAARALERQSYTAKDGELFLLAAGVVSIGFFFLNTEMHERYAYPAVVFLGGYAVISRDYFLYILVSVAHFLNISAVFWLMGVSLPIVRRSLTPELTAVLFLIAMGVGLAQLYRRRALSSDVQELALAFRRWRAAGVPVVSATQ